MALFISVVKREMAGEINTNLK